MSIPAIRVVTTNEPHPYHEKDKQGRRTFDRNQEIKKDETDTDPRSSQGITTSYQQIKSQIVNLDKKLGRFLKECRQLGRSYALIVATQKLRDTIQDVHSIVRRNAERLSFILQPRRESVSRVIDDDYLSTCSEKLEDMANAFKDIRECLDEFREYTDESVKIKELMNQFHDDMKYRAACLLAHKIQFDQLAMHNYIHDIAVEMGRDMDTLIQAFNFFIEYGIPAMQHEQKRDNESMLNMSTVATFFSAVTATTLQTSIGIETTSIILKVNAFWFCSLVLSIGAALNSLLVVAWKRTTYGSRGQRLPLWVSVWIHASAPFFLALSIICFSVGLALFTYASAQAGYTQVVTLVATAVTSVGLIIVSAWFAYESWIVPILRSKKKSPTDRSGNNPKQPRKPGPIPLLRDTSMQPPAPPFSILSILTSSLSTVGGILSFGPVTKPNLHQVMDPELQRIENPVVANDRRKARERWGKATTRVASTRLATMKFWQGIPRTIPRMAHPNRTDSDRPNSPALSIPISPHILIFPSQPSRILNLPYGLVQDLEYSPDGKYLAITSFDEHIMYSTTMVYISGDYHYSYRNRHPKDVVSKQVMWSPDSSLLLVRLDHAIDILDPHCKPLQTISRTTGVKSVAWRLNKDDTCFEILSIEGNSVIRLSLEGNVLSRYKFKDLSLRDIAVIPQTDLFIVVGRLIIPPEGTFPRNATVEKQLILYDMKNSRYKSCNPMLNDVRHIELSNHYLAARKGFDVLLSHTETPGPRLWTLEANIQGRHVLKQGPHLRSSAELSGYGYFAGDCDHMMLSMNADGDIHIWDRTLCGPVDCIKAQAIMNSRRGIAWSPLGTDTVTFATGGAKQLKIWTMKQPDGSYSYMPERNEFGSESGFEEVAPSPTDFGRCSNEFAHAHTPLADQFTT